MKKNEIIAKVTTAVNTATIKVKKHSPEILIVAGVVGTVAGALMANSATNMIPFAHGGVVHAASGFRVPGNSYSGDLVPALLNSGETVLNQAQTGNLAAQLEDPGGLKNLRLSTEFDAEKIIITLNNNGRRTGRGELVTSNIKLW